MANIRAVSVLAIRRVGATPKRQSAMSAIFVALILAACAHHGRNVRAHHLVVVMGDSLTVGVGASQPGRGFVYNLYGRIAGDDPTAQIVNYGVAGARIADVARDQLPRAPATGVTDVWICVGANDVLSGASAEGIATEEDALALSARSRWPDAHLVLFGTLDVARAPIVPAEAKLVVRRRAAAANDAVRVAADHARAEFVDLFKFSDRRLDAAQDVSSDGFHPNDLGYTLLADFAEDAVR